LDKYENVLSPIKVLCLINETKVIGVLDTGANISVIDKSLVQKLKLEIEPRKSSIFQAFKGNIQYRTEVVRIVIRVGKESANILLEVANLHRKVKLLIGMNLFKQLGFKLKNVSFL
jgi:predicted aspartyl protease